MCNNYGIFIFEQTKQPFTCFSETAGLFYIRPLVSLLQGWCSCVYRGFVTLPPHRLAVWRIFRLKYITEMFFSYVLSLLISFSEGLRLDYYYTVQQLCKYIQKQQEETQCHLFHSSLIVWSSGPNRQVKQRGQEGRRKYTFEKLVGLESFSSITSQWAPQLLPEASFQHMTLAWSLDN